MICCNSICFLPVCSVNSDCDDDNSLTFDTCDDAGTCSAECSNVECSVECNTDRDCLAGRTCFNSGTCNSYCAYCETNNDCDEGELCCNGECEEIVCLTDADCGFDNECINPGTCSSNCEASTCLTDSDCNIGRACCSNSCEVIVCGQQYFDNIILSNEHIIGDNIALMDLLNHNPADNSLLIKVYNETDEFFNNREILPYNYTNEDLFFNITIHDYNTNTDYVNITWIGFCPNENNCTNIDYCSNECLFE
jgi:hypothetical protein